MTRIALVTGAGSGIGTAVAVALAARRLDGRPRRATPRDARGDRRDGGERRDPDHLRRHRSCLRRVAVRRDRRALRQARPALQQRGRRRSGDSARGPQRRAVAVGRRHEPHGRVPLHAGGLPADEAAGAPRRPDHQQRLDLGDDPAPAVCSLHGDEARDHRPDEIDGARRPRLRHRVRPDRHRQRGDRHDQGGAPTRARCSRTEASSSSRPSTPCTSARRSCTWPACRSTPTSSR